MDNLCELIEKSSWRKIIEVISILISVLFCGLGFFGGWDVALLIFIMFVFIIFVCFLFSIIGELSDYMNYR